MIYLTSEIPKKHDDLVCLFPNHKDYKNPKKQILRIAKYSYLSSFNKEINARIGNSLEETAVGMRIKFAVAYGNQVYICKDMTGPVYIVWATYVNRINLGNVAKTLNTMVPLIINTDGQYCIKSIFVLKKTVEHASDHELLPRAKGNPRVFLPREPIFVCESRPMEQLTTVIKTVSEREAIAAVTATTKPAKHWLAHEENVFELREEGVLWNHDGSFPLHTELRLELQSKDSEDEEILFSTPGPEPDPYA
jgi:hypothetical protein